jgi:hypothetical protein
MNDELQAIEGMTLRDYFAAHAPNEPEDWFMPFVKTDRPTEIRIVWTDGDNQTERTGNFGCKNWEELAAWDMEYQRQLFLQWRWAYADAMLKAREQ